MSTRYWMTAFALHVAAASLHFAGERDFADILWRLVALTWMLIALRTDTLLDDERRKAR